MALSLEMNNEQDVFSSIATNASSSSNFRNILNAEKYSGNDKDYIPISDFYAGRSVFITGGTGFMGKVRGVHFLIHIDKYRNCKYLSATRKIIFKI